MPSGIVVVMTNATEGADDAFNEWYDAVHLADVLTLPGFVAAQRFVAVPSIHGEMPAQRYLAIYETDDIESAQQALREASAEMSLSPTLDRASVVTYSFAALGDRAES